MLNLTPPPDMPDLRRLSAAIGRDLTIVQGAGGNTSVKDQGILWVKASGTWLAEAQARDIFLPLDLAVVVSHLDRGDEDCVTGALLSDCGRHPSIEVALHGLLPHRVVLHVHCVDTIRWAVRTGGPEQIAGRLQGLPWGWVPYRRPGAELAVEVRRVVSEASRSLDVLVLANHGLVVGGESTVAAARLLAVVRERLQTPTRQIDEPRPVRGVPPPGWAWAEEPLVDRIAFDPTARAVARQGVLYPDHAVFLGPSFPELRALDLLETDLASMAAASGFAPQYAVLPEVGVLLSHTLSAGALAMLQCLGLVTARITDQDVTDQRVRYLSTSQVAALMDWDAEKYRQSLATPQT